MDELIKLLAAKEEQINKLLIKIDNMQAQLEGLLRILYGKKCEKKQPSATEDKHLANNKTASAVQPSSNNNKPVRKVLPEHIERQVIKYELLESERICYLCKQVCHCIGKEVTEQLEFIPARLYVKEHRRYKYGCRHGCSVKIATMPKQPIPKGITGLDC